ncbi:hypothetical protein [Chryseobacterium kwangjuense]|uniref:Lipoprotein n=1 Tax=Chryseobacterium kwangjuense TaxID=267125 RepID=A0A135W986_9FLAO|nr:hypothetical protein [Chryseobacterium kwangjuense]KXH81446.1 hypothetical protein AU378_17235 [Chryseobacterium kwangjuense]
MRIFIICTVLFFTSSCKAQNNQNLHLEIISFFKINEKDIQRCQKEREELLKHKMNITTIETTYNQCIGHYKYLNYYKENTLKMLEKISNNEDFFIINYISDNSYSPYRTKTILKTNIKYYGLKHYFTEENSQFVDRNEEFEVSKSEIEDIQKIDEYLKTGKSEYIDNKKGGLVGNNVHLYIVARNNGKVIMKELFRIK